MPNRFPPRRRAASVVVHPPFGAERLFAAIVVSWLMVTAVMVLS